MWRKLGEMSYVLQMSRLGIQEVLLSADESDKSNIRYAIMVNMG